MSYVQWEWDLSASGSGLPNGEFTPTRHSPLVKNETDAGYRYTRAAFPKDYWTFRVGWNAISPSGYIYVMDFFHSHRGGQLFYMEWPVALYGIPYEYYFADPGGTGIWSSETEIGYGEGPNLLVQFITEEMSASRVMGPENYWQLTFEVRQFG